MRRALGAGVMAIIVITAVPAAGEEPARSGWWYVGVPAPPPAAAGVLAPGGAPAPDVPPGGISVSGSAAHPLTVAALEYVLAEGVRPSRLRLLPHAALPGTAVVACQILPEDLPFNSDAGGSADRAPRYDCSRSIAASVAPDGSYSFDLEQLGTTSRVALALVPAGAVDRIVFERPNADSLEVVLPPSDGGDGEGGAGMEDTPPPIVVRPGPTEWLGSAPSSPALGPRTPPEPQDLDVPQHASPSPAAFERSAPGTWPTTDGTPGLFMALATAAVALWWFAGRAPTSA